MANPDHLRKALEGVDAWNAWRAENPDITIDLSETDFTQPEYRGLSFAGFEFGDDAQFSESTFGNDANFSGSIFGHHANFSEAKFGHLVSFSKSIFGNKAAFSEATFGYHANFSKTQFGHDVDFSKTVFDFGADFSEAILIDGATFLGSTFGLFSNFSGATFGNGVTFSGAVFGDRVNFYKVKFGRGIGFSGSKFVGMANFSEATFGDWANFSMVANISEKMVFQSVFFTDVTFHGSVDFSNRDFLGETLFRRTLFKGVPRFHNCQLHQDTDFFGAEFRDAKSPGAARAYRTLKLAMEQQQASEEAHHFFILELKARQNEEWEKLRQKKQRLKKGKLGVKKIPAWWRVLALALRRLFFKPTSRRWWVLWRVLRRSCHVLRIYLLKPISLCAVGSALGLYGWVSDYGRSLLRPLLIWFGLGAGAYGFYSHFLNAPLWSWNGTIAAFSLSRGVPFFGAGRDDPLGDLEATFCRGNPDCSADFYWVEIAAILQSVFSVILIFLFLLAIRNRFKIK